MILLLYLLMCMIFSTTFLAIKIGLQAGLPPIFSAGIRFLLAGVLVCLFFVIRKHRFPKDLKVYFDSMIIGFFLTGIPFATLYWGEQYISSGLASLLSSMGPIMVSLLYAIYNKQKMKGLPSLGLLISFGGVTVSTLPSLTGELNRPSMYGALAIVAGAFFYSLGTVKSKNITDSHCSPLLLNGIQMIFGAIILLMFAWFVELRHHSYIWNTEGWLSILYLAVVGSIVGHGVYFWLVRKTNPIFPSTWLFVSPTVAVILGSLLLKEQITLYIIIGGSLIFVGLLLVNKEVLQQLFHKSKKESRVMDHSHNKSI